MPASYKFLIIDTYYPAFLKSIYDKFTELAEKSYADQRDFIMGQCFGTADFYSKNLIKLGSEAEEIIPDNEILQERWAVENGIKIERSYLTGFAKKNSLLKKLPFYRKWLLNILTEQIKRAKPDVLYIQNLSFCPPAFLLEMKRHVKLLVGQIACPLPDKKVFAPYDLILSSLPHYVDRFNSMGLRSKYFKIGFEGSLPDRVVRGDQNFDVVHAGGYGPIHDERNHLLEAIADRVDIKFWGYGVNNLSPASPILKNYNGESWGKDRYQIFAHSKIVVTKHIFSVANKYCNNMTLYEATGMGSLLLTDYKENLPEIFVPNEEVVTYTSADEAVQKIKYYMEHEKERKQIASAGQRKTLGEHSYYNRMYELVEIIAGELR